MRARKTCKVYPFSFFNPRGHKGLVSVCLSERNQPWILQLANVIIDFCHGPELIHFCDNASCDQNHQ